ncbi:MAG: ABC-F family ATP-binding cassette domain-containing protein [Clostridia bacterium]|nr:ABC-F family ATP-binding cassette domain-containing protein [Clostridia bacterium]
MRLRLDGINVTFGENEVLKNIHFEVNDNDKIAVIGRNGSGKTTLLRVLMGEQDIDTIVGGVTSDKIQKTGKFEIGYLKQIAFEDDLVTLEDEVLKVFKPIIELKERIDALEASMMQGIVTKEFAKYEEMLTLYNRLGGYTYLKEYNLALKKFGFTDADKFKKIGEFSGGQRTKIALIKLLLSKPDLLILDEPTNHLDITTIKWLEDYLANYPKAVIVVSHDRAFLDRFVNVVYELERNEIKKYIGNYSDFVKKKQIDYERRLKDYEEFKAERDRLQSLADRFRYKATKAKMAQSKLKQIERMGVVENPIGADNKVFSTKTKPRVESGNDIMFADDISIGYDRVLTRLSFRVMKGDRIGVVGGNGLGKSTLLKSIVGKVPLLGGKIKFGTNIEIGYFDQQTATKNIEDECVLDNYIKEFPDDTTTEARTTLGSFLFSGDDVFKNLKDLSGGELVRLELCKIFKRRPNFLILDEPTNHMDIASKEALEAMLENYEGTLIFVSHDRYFIRRIATSLIVFENGGGRYLKDTNYADYEGMLNDLQQETNIEVVKVENATEKKQDIEISEGKKVNLYLQNKEKAKKDARLKKLERLIAEAEKNIVELSEQFNSPDVCSDYVKVLEIQSQIDKLNEEIQNYTEEWYSLSE